MIEQTIPSPFNREAVLVNGDNLVKKYDDYQKKDGSFQKFMGNEVEIIACYLSESLTPRIEAPDTVFIGRWMRHKDDRLYVRASDSYGISRIALAQEHRKFRDGIPMWSHVLTSSPLNGTFYPHIANYGLSLDEITDAVALIIEFESALRTYELMKS